MRLFTTSLICVAAILPLAAVAQSATYTVDVSSTSVSPGDVVTVSWDTTAADVTRDWIGLYGTTASDRNYIDWDYVDAAAGSLSFVIPSTGSYELRYFLNNGYTQVATSPVITATGDSNGYTYTLDTDQTTYTSGDPIVVSWDAPAGSQDWIGLYAEDAADRSYIDWNYVDGNTGTMTFTAGTAGAYEVRYLLNNGYTVEATATFTVTEDDSTGGGGGASDYTLSPAQTQITTGDALRVAWSAPTAGNQDWIGLYRVGAAARSYVDWGYVSGSSGTLDVTIDSAGTYELRYLLNNGYTVATVSAPIIVTDPDDGGGGGSATGYDLIPDQTTYDRGDTARVTWSVPNGTSFFRNWIGMYRPGDADNQYIDFEYVDILSYTETFRLDAEGEYEFRFFTRNSYNKVATSDQITVSNDMSTACTLDVSNITNIPTGSGPVIALGDSITFGIGASAGEDYVSELADRLNTLVINAGVSGDTTRDALARLQTDVLDQNPSAVIVFLGGNDEIRRFYEQLNNTAVERALEDELDDLAADIGYDWMSVPLIPRAETFSNIESIITQIQSTGAATILVGFDATIYDSQIDDDYQQIANNTGSFFVSDIYNGIFARPRYMSDLVHPNDAGYDIVADRIQPAVACVI